MTVAFKIFGCRLNRAEALDEEAAWCAAGHTVVELGGTTPPDYIIVRGCSVTARAARDCEKEITRLRALYPTAEIRRTGCLPNATPSAVVSNTTSPTAHAEPLPPSRFSAPNAPISLATSRAFLKVQDGCSGRCAFCIVPRFRGAPVSMPFHDVLARARALLAAGFHELVVTGCNLALYHSEGHNLPTLLAALADLPTPTGTVPPQTGTVPPQTGTDPTRTGTVPPPPMGTVPPQMGTVPTHRVRLGSLEPGINADELLDVFEKHQNICRFIHLSVQSGSDRILSLMNRPYQIRVVREFCAEARRRLGPRLMLGADIITGFPGETESDFAQTETFLFDSPTPITNLHVFPYSERPGTRGATFAGTLPPNVRRARAHTLDTRAQTARLAFARTFIGQDVEVCIEKGGLHGWTDEYLPCRLTGAPAERRTLITCRVTGIAPDGTLTARTTIQRK